MSQSETVPLEPSTSGRLDQAIVPTNLFHDISF